MTKTKRDRLVPALVLLAAFVSVAMAGALVHPASAAPLAQDTHRIVVLAYPDLAGEGPGGADCPGCDDKFSTSDALKGRDDPLPKVEVVLRDADGKELDRLTSDELPNGRQAVTFDVDEAADYEIELVAVPSDWELCAGSSTQVSVGKSDFESDTLTARVQFGFWHGCEKPTAEPTATPTTEAPTEAAPTAQPTASPQQPTPTATTPAAATTAPTEAAAATATPLTAAMPPTPGAIQGLVFIDANGDGLLASDEPGVAGVTIQLRGGGMALSQVTSTAGSYSFGGLSPGAYEVSIELPWGYALTTSDRYSNVQVANDIVVGVDFGLTPLQYAAPTAEAGEPTLPSAGVAVLPAGGMLLGLAGIVGVLGLLGIAVEAGRSRRDIASNSRKDS